MDAVFSKGLGTLWLRVDQFLQFVVSFLPQEPVLPRNDVQHSFAAPRGQSRLMLSDSPPQSVLSSTSSPSDKCFLQARAKPASCLWKFCLGDPFCHLGLRLTKRAGKTPNLKKKFLVEPHLVDAEFRKAWVPFCCRLGHPAFLRFVDPFLPQEPFLDLPQIAGQDLFDVARG